MPLRLQIWLLVLLPVLALAGVLAFGVKIPVPYLGRDYVVRFMLPEPDAKPGLPEIEGPADSGQPLIVIDAGHGGHDPGASGEEHTEKDIVLGLAQALRDRLLKQGGIRVALTRGDDHFLVLEERAEIARQLDADLFLSIHADSAGDKSGVQGASIYTLSGKASSRAAERYAERENAADRVNGVQLAGTSSNVSAILVDLSQRHAQQQSDQLAHLILREGQGVLKFHPDPIRSASLVVLKAPDVPSVLYEAGYISNSDDAGRLASPEGQQRFAEVLARAIRIYFVRTGQVG